MSKNIPAIPEPTMVQESQRETLVALKHGVETLGGLRGDGMDSAVTFNDLVKLGLITAARAKKIL